MGRRRTILLLLLLLPAALPAQSSHWELALGGEYMVTRYDLASPHNTFVASLEATWLHRLSDTACWVQMRHQPSVGVRLDAGLAPQGISGHRLGAVGLLRTPLRPWLDLDLGLGLSTYSKPRYVTGDTANVYISTPLTILVDIGLVAHLDARSHVALRLLHSSNGNMRRPNRGLNFLHLEVGMALDDGRRPSPREAFGSSGVQCPFDPHHELGLMAAAGLTFSRHSMQRGVYLCYDLSLNYQYRRSPLVGYGATVDLWYNFSHVWQLPRYQDRYTTPVYVSAMPYVEFYWGPISLRGGIGAHLLTSSRVLVPVYERLAVYYHFGRSYAGIGINAHYGQAEFIEWSFGHWFPL